MNRSLQKSSGVAWLDEEDLSRVTNRSNKGYTVMLTKMTLATAVVAAAAFFTPVSAAPLASQTNLAQATKTDSGLITQVHYRRHHHRYYRYRYFHHHGWRHRCAARWGWGSRGYYRCLRRHF